MLEARGLVPRRGVVVALSASELPNPQVTVSMPGQPELETPVLPHNLTPRWVGLLGLVYREGPFSLHTFGLHLGAGSAGNARQAGQPCAGPACTLGTTTP